MARTILILGAAAPLAQRVGRALVREDDAVLLADDDPAETQLVAADLGARRACTVETMALDAADPARCGALAADVLTRFGAPDIVIVATGVADARPDPIAAASMIAATASATGPLVDAMAAQGAGLAIVLCSIAGARGHATDDLHDAGVAGLNAYLRRLRRRLHRSGVRIASVNVDAVDPHTAIEGPFVAGDLDRIAEAIAALVDTPRDVVYFPFYRQWAVAAARLVPDALYKRLPF
ncbi:MAG: SDR family NAD(P)-dependent oxidoreductase [Pseudomonadota bacterium]